MTTIKNREVFYKDPTLLTIPNDGVAKVGTPQSEDEWKVLRYELQSFVCDGEYRRGLERILATYLAHLDRDTQPAVWVSGFYGSGKSHLVRVLEYLWRDVEFPKEGVTARGLANLSRDVSDHLTELTVTSRRGGGLWSAAGTLTAGGGSVRLAMLSILFRSAGLHEKYSAARLLIWLKQRGYFDGVKRTLAAQSRDLMHELTNMYVSEPLHKALLDMCPGFASSIDEARIQLRTQFPIQNDIGDDEMVATMRAVLELQAQPQGSLPCTLLVFDELQQFIGEDPQRTAQVQNVVEKCSSSFGRRLLFVATGQSALQATPQLSKLQGRFTVGVTLSDKDVEQVVREVILRKRQDKVPVLQAALERASGEINRQLAGTAIGPTAADGAELVPDYPLLPVRRRFWERVLRAVDSAGTAGQLRTQLRIVHEATRAIADRPLGTVIAGDLIYEQLRSYMLQSGVLLRDVETMIAEQDDGTPDGQLRARLCRLIFLIGRLPSGGVNATGLKATRDTLADLLVEDLGTASGDLRRRIPDALQALVDRGTLLQVGDEYRLQTRESAEWEQDFRRNYARILADDQRIAGDRTAELRQAIEAALKGLSLTQGASKVVRKPATYFSADAPPVDGSNVPVWVRDEWSVTERAARDEAQRLGVDSPIVTIYLRRPSGDALKSALAGAAAAKETLETRARAATSEGQEAALAMESRRAQERRRVETQIGQIIGTAIVLQGGGNDIVEPSLQLAARRAVEASLARLFPRFGLGDHAGWGKVVDRATEGAADAITAVGWSGDVEKHPVCQEILTFVGGAGKKGQEVRKHFTGPPYGWSQDAVDGALLVLLACGTISASRSGAPAQAKGMQQGQLGTVDFRGEVPVQVKQRIEVRKLLGDMGIQARSNEETAAIQIMFRRMQELAVAAGGSAPLPERPSTAALAALQAQSGNQQLLAVHEARATLLADYQAWKRAGELSAQRLPRWERLQQLLGHANGLAAVQEVEAQAQAIRTNRALLVEPDPLPPLLEKVASALRTEMQDAQRRFAEARAREVASIEGSDEWQRLAAEPGRLGEPKNIRQRLLDEHGLGEITLPPLGTDADLLLALESTRLAQWDDRIAALPARAAQVRARIAGMLEPAAVSLRPRPATLRTPGDVEAYLGRLRSDIMKSIEAGNPVIIQI